LTYACYWPYKLQSFSFQDVNIHGITSTMASVRSRPNTTLQNKISQMRLTLAPIYPLPQGPPHAAYPSTLLHFWLLTEAQLDSIAQYYHQTSPTNEYQRYYPACMNWDRDFLAIPHKLMSKAEQEACLPDEERLAIKRRMFGKFIGLRGCNTPVEEFEKRVKFLENKFEQSITRERQMMGRKWVYDIEMD
jgi:hypothetical protein